MTEGTKSYLFGGHHFFLHPLFVLRAWKAIYGKQPKLWQVVCIFLHDAGIAGRQFKTGDKRGHWQRGAYIAGVLFGEKGYLFCAGHTTESGQERSELFKPDKASFLYSPRWWLQLCHTYIDRYTCCTLDEWLEIVRRNVAAGYERDSHDIYLEMREQKQ